MTIRFPTPQTEVAQIDYRYDHIIAVERGHIKELLWYPRNVVTHPDTNQIYVANKNDYYACISIFSDTGEYLNKIQHKDMKNPWGISIHQDYIYVTDYIQQFLLKFQIADNYPLVAKVGDVEGVSEQLWVPKGVAVSNIGGVFVIDSRNKQLKIFDIDLYYQRLISDDSLTNPVDLKICTGVVYVLNSPYYGYTSFCVFSFAGEKLRSIILHSSVPGLKKFGSAFCFDANGDIVICDSDSHKISLYTRDGNFIYTLGARGDEVGKFSYPQSLALTANRKLVVTSWNSNFFLQIFS